jgi:hypothetical protein
MEIFELPEQTRWADLDPNFHILVTRQIAYSTVPEQAIHPGHHYIFSGA